MVGDFGLEIVVEEENQVVAVGTMDIVVEQLGMMVVGSKGIDSMIADFVAVEGMIGTAIVEEMMGTAIVEETN